MVEAFNSIQAIHRVTKFYISSEKLDGASIGFTGNKIASTDVLNVLVCFVHNPAHHACEIKVTKLYGNKHVWKETPADRLTFDRMASHPNRDNQFQRPYNRKPLKNIYRN